MKLVFQLEKNELMNKRIVAPHSELNPEIYADVDSIVSRNPVEDLSISIYTAPVSEALQNKIREIFREHYDDEYNAVRKELQKVYFHMGLFAVLTLIVFAVILNVTRIYGELALLVVFGYLCSSLVDHTVDAILTWKDKSIVLEKLARTRSAEILFFKAKNLR